MSETINLIWLLTQQNFIALKKLFIGIGLLGGGLIVVNLLFPHSIITSTLLLFLWLLTAVFIGHVQFVIHEIAHFREANKHGDFKWFVMMQGPFGAMMVRSENLADELSLKELEAPYKGLFFIFNLVLMVIQVSFAIYMVLLIPDWLVVLPLVVLLTVTLIKYAFDICATLLVYYWHFFSPKKAWPATKLKILIGDDLLQIANLRSMAIPKKLKDFYDNYDDKEVYEKIQHLLKEGKREHLATKGSLIMFR